jgi:hypothetical protein
MGRDAEDSDHAAFIRFEGLRAPGRDEDAVLSRAAFQMHGFGMLNSIRDGHPGFVSDDYLNAIAAETSPPPPSSARRGCGFGWTTAMKSSTPR